MSLDLKMFVDFVYIITLTLLKYSLPCRVQEIICERFLVLISLLVFIYIVLEEVRRYNLLSLT